LYCASRGHCAKAHGVKSFVSHTTIVIPAKAGIQVVTRAVSANQHASHEGTTWILAFARMTMVVGLICVHLRKSASKIFRI
jgi:hypothetical protein